LALAQAEFTRVKNRGAAYVELHKVKERGSTQGKSAPKKDDKALRPVRARLSRFMHGALLIQKAVDNDPEAAKAMQSGKPVRAMSTTVK
jgi:hypothetical protein